MKASTRKRRLKHDVQPRTSWVLDGMVSGGNPDDLEGPKRRKWVAPVVGKGGRRQEEKEKTVGCKRGDSEEGICWEFERGMIFCRERVLVGASVWGV
jgi:hypothetical protein